MPVDSLTPQEAEVVRLVAMGLTNRRIAKELGIEVSTVNTHVHHAADESGEAPFVEIGATWPGANISCMHVFPNVLP